MAYIRYVTLLAGILVTFTAGELDKCYYVPQFKIQMIASTNVTIATSSAANVSNASAQTSSTSTPASVTTPDASASSTPSASTPVAVSSVSSSSVPTTVASTSISSTGVTNNTVTTPSSVTSSTVEETSSELTTEVPSTPSVPSTTEAPESCNYTFAWKGFVTAKNTTLAYMDMNETTVNFFSNVLNNLTEETNFIRGHFNYTKNLISNYTHTSNCSEINILLFYDCCYDPNSRSTCDFKQIINGNVSISSTFNSSSGGLTSQSSDTGYWIFNNDTVMRTFWSDMKIISNRWTKFKSYADGMNSPHDARGSTKISPYNATHVLVNCSVSANDLYGVSLSWYSPDDDYTDKYNVSTWAVNVNGTGSGWSSIYVRNETVSNLKCYASSSSLWDSYLPVPYNGPVPLGSEIPFALIFAICLTLVVFILIGCVACCMFVCRRRDSASISAL